MPISRAALETVMVRRLKEDLRSIGIEKFPKRKVVQIDVGAPDAPEVELSRLLAEYTRLMKPGRGREQLVFINLQKRLLSSVEAFRRTLDVHAKSAFAGQAKTHAQLTLAESADDDEYGADDDALESAAATAMEAASRLLQSPEGRARDVLEKMQRAAAQLAQAPDAKAKALLAWIRQHQCPGVRAGGAQGRGADLKWSGCRVIVFTEYGDTKRYLSQLLGAAIEGTHLDDERIMLFHGGMSDEQREEVQTAFNSAPGDHPVRILIATDAAREGLNLQGHCADLFHFDLPWNPARLEQRNGRIDRTGQWEPEVRCHYFLYPHRSEDLVLKKIVAKVETIQKELGSLGSVVMERLADVLDRGIDETTADAIEAAETSSDLRATVRDELESQRELAKMKKDIDENARIASGSRKVIDFDPALLRGVLDVGLAMTGAGPLTAAEKPPEGVEAWTLPTLGASWQGTLDALRRPRTRDESFYDWRDNAPPLPVSFSPPPRLNSAIAQLHLSHPFVQRIMSRFLSQGFSAHDLSRVTALRNPHDDEVIVFAFGRLSLFGPGATRLHDELIPVAARWKESGGRGHRVPLADKDEGRAIEQLHRLLRDLSQPGHKGKGIPKKAAGQLAQVASEDFTAIWDHVKDDADSLAHQAEQKLQVRATAEAQALAKLLAEQRAAIEKELRRRSQLRLEFTEAEKDQLDQYERDRAYLSDRLTSIAEEIETEPDQIRSLYEVALRRLEPVGLIYLWPETMS